MCDNFAKSRLIFKILTVQHKLLKLSHFGSKCFVSSRESETRATGTETDTTHLSNSHSCGVCYCWVLSYASSTGAPVVHLWILLARMHSRADATCSQRHHVLNDLIWRSLSKAGFPAVKEPQVLLRTDGKPPDGLTLIQWRDGHCVTWDVTVTDTVAAS